MKRRGWQQASWLVGLTVVVLLACKKKEEPPPPIAAPDAAPAVTTTAEPAATAAATEDATAPSDEPSKPIYVRTDAGLIKDAGAKDAAAKDAGVDAGKDAATGSPADAKAIQACCTAITIEAKKAGPHQNKYNTAAATCNGVAAKVKAGTVNASAARTLIRAQLQGVPMPSGC